MAANVVEIFVKANDGTGPGFASSRAHSAEAAAGFDELAAAQDKVTQAEMKLRQAEIQQTDAQLKLEELQQSGTAKADELAAAQDKVTQATIRAADAQIRLGEADARLAAAEKGAGDAAQVQAAKTEETAAAASKGGREFTLFGGTAALALGAVGYEAVKMSMSFQAAMERLVTQAGVPQAKLGELKAGVLALAGAVGFSPNSLATSLFHIESNFASLGITAPKALNLVRIAAEGAKVGNADLEEVTNALTAAVASGIPGVQSFSQAMGALNAIVGAGDMKMQDLAEAMGTGVMAVVKGYGLSLKDVGAALDVFGDNNIRGAHAATALRMAVQSLAVPAATGKKLLADMGLSMSSLADTMRQHGLLAALEELQAHFKAAGITAQEQGDIITQIFGKKAGVGLAVLMDQMDRLKSKYPAITAGASDFGSAWQKTGQTLSQQWDQIRATFDALMVSLGQKLIPVLSSIAGFLLRNKGIIEALAPVVMAVVGAFTALKFAMAAVSLVSDLNPVSLAIMAIAAATVLVIEHFQAVKRAVAEVFDWIKSHWVLLVPLLATPLGPIIALGLGIYQLVKHFGAVEDAGKTAARVIGDAWSQVWDATIGPVIRAFDAVKSAITGGFDSWWKSHGEEVKQVWDAAWRVISANFKMTWDIIVTIVKTAWGILMATMKPGLDLLVTSFKTAWDEISAIFKAAWDIIAGVVKIAVAGVTTTVKVAWDLLVGLFNVFLDLITGHWSKAWHDIQATVQQVMNAVKGWLGATWDAIRGAAIAAWNALLGGVKSVLANLLGLVSRLPGEILHALGDLSHLLFEAGVHVVEGFIHGIESMFGQLAAAAGHMVLSLGHTVLHFLGIGSPSRVAHWWGQMVAQGLADGIDDWKHLAAGAAQRMAAGVSGNLGAGPGSGGSWGTAAQTPAAIQFVMGGGGSGLDSLFWAWLKAGVRAQGGDPRMFTKKVAFIG